MTLHWADDPVGQLVQCRRALEPDGLLIAVCLGGETLFELRQALTEAELAIRGGVAPRIAPMGDLRDLGGLLGRAGLALTVADQSRVTVTYSGFDRLIGDLRAMGETSALAARDPRPLTRRIKDKTAEVYRARFATPDGSLPARFDLMFLTGWAPAPTQPKPLRPGSATSRLADALGTRELDAGSKPDS
jgi:hypothetical protein